MTLFCARVLIFPCATLAAGIKATPGSSLGKWLWVRRYSRGLATSRHPASGNPATTGTQESVCSLCGQLHIFSSPWKKIKRAATKIRPVSHLPSNHEVGQEQSPKAPGLYTRGAWFPWAGGKKAPRSEMPTVPQPYRGTQSRDRLQTMTAATPLQTCCAVTLGRRKTQNKFHVVFPTW